MIFLQQEISFSICQWQFKSNRVFHVSVKFAGILIGARDEILAENSPDVTDLYHICKIAA